MSTEVQNTTSSQHDAKLPVSGWQEFDEQKLIEGQMYLWKYSGKIEERIYAGSYMNYFKAIKPKFVPMPACH